MKLSLPAKLSLFSFIIFLLPNCGAPQLSHPKSVEIPQTVVKRQAEAGLCWAYGAAGFLEALLLKKNQMALDLSEESLGFYRMAEELSSMSHRFTAAELATADMVKQKSYEDLEGWDVVFQPAYNPGFPAPNGFELVRLYGIVPEEVWSYKFLTTQQYDKFFKAVYTGFAAMMQKYGQNNITQEMIYALLAGPEIFGSRPPVEFAFHLPNGTTRTFSAVNFAADFIGFTPDDYTYMTSDDKIGYAQLVKAMKLTLARGLDVPFGYTIYKDQPNAWNGAFSVKNINPDTLVSTGGHVVLVTDFVNMGSKPGAIANAQLPIEVAKSAEELDFVVIKNSWDTKAQSPLLRWPGYQTIDQSYLKALARHSADITIVVPRDIAFQVRYENVGP